MGELDGRVPRRSALPRLREAAMREAGSRAERAPAAARQMVDIDYEENGETKQQRWFVEEPHSVLLRARVDEQEHVLVHIKNIPGWQGMPRQRCSICKKGAVTTWCCVYCSSHNGILAIHAEACQRGGAVRERRCMATHRTSLHLVDADGGHTRARPHKERQGKAKKMAAPCRGALRSLPAAS